MGMSPNDSFFRPNDHFQYQEARPVVKVGPKATLFLRHELALLGMKANDEAATWRQAAVAIILRYGDQYYWPYMGPTG